MYTIAQIENHLAGMGHGRTLSKVVNKFHVYERAANNMMSKVDVITLMRTAPLTNAVHSQVYNYPLPSDFGKLIDLYPQANRQSRDFGFQVSADTFDALKLINNKRISLESENGTRFLRIDWDVNTNRTLDAVNSANNWSAVGSAANIVADNLFYISGTASLRFDVVASGDGVKNESLDALDLTEWDEQATLFVWVYIPSPSDVTSITARWGNDVSANYWESVAQTAQADGTAFKTGWNLIRLPWDTATETGTVDPSAIDSFQLTIAGNAQTDVRIDNIIVSLGELFEAKYYSAYMFQTNSGTWIQRPTTDTDLVIVDEAGLNIYLYEVLMAAAQQMEGTDSAFDINFARTMLHGDPGSSDPNMRRGLYSKYKALYPSQTKKQTSSWMTGRDVFGRHWLR